MITDRAKANREKVARFAERKRAAGIRSTTVYLNKEAWAALAHLKSEAREAGEPCTNGDVVGAALIAMAANKQNGG